MGGANIWGNFSCWSIMEQADKTVQDYLGVLFKGKELNNTYDC